MTAAKLWMLCSNTLGNLAVRRQTIGSKKKYFKPLNCVQTIAQASFKMLSKSYMFNIYVLAEFRIK